MRARRKVRRGKRRHPIRLAPSVNFHLGVVWLREQLQLAVRDKNFIRRTGGLERQWCYLLRDCGFFRRKKLDGCVWSYLFFVLWRGRGNGDGNRLACRLLSFFYFGLFRKLPHLYLRPMICITAHGASQHHDSDDGRQQHTALAGKDGRGGTLYRNRFLSQSWRGRGGPGSVSGNHPQRQYQRLFRRRGRRADGCCSSGAHRPCQFVIFKIADKLRAGLVTIVRRFGQCLGDNRAQTGMDSYIQIAWRDRVFVDDFVNDRRNILADEWFFASQHLVKNYAQAKEIGPSIQLAAFYLLGGHVIRRAQNLPGIGDLAAGLGDAEVHDG